MKENGFEYVDLGLPSGTMWATCNVGATKPEDEGLLFQFGRVDGYKYGDENHKFRTNDLTTTSGKVYKENETLDLEDDAAYVNMGGAWRMPTSDELQELINNTTYNVVTVNGIQGMLFTSTKSRYEDKQLFIPFNHGYWYDGNWEIWNNTVAIMWSSQVLPSFVNFAYLLFCNSSGSDYIFSSLFSSLRSYALSVRGVFKK